jgi:hypothetical protein
MRTVLAALAVVALAGCASSSPTPAANPTLIPPSSAAAASSPTAASSSAPSGLSAGCQAGIDDGGFAPVTQQNLGGQSAYQVTVTNNTGSPVTVMGFAVTFTAFGSTITTDNPTVNTSLIEPAEKWNFTVDVTSGIQVSDNTYLNETCTVTEVDTANGMVAPIVVPMGNGEQSTAQQVQVNLSTDLVNLQNDTSALNEDTTLAADVSQMQKDWKQEKADWATESASSCPNQPPINGGDTVGTDADAVGTDYDGLQGDVNSLQNGKVAAVNDDLSAVQKDLTSLHNLGATPDVSTSASSAAGGKALTSAASAITWADGQGSSINNQAQALATTAENYANNHLCD